MGRQRLGRGIEAAGLAAAVLCVMSASASASAAAACRFPAGGMQLAHHDHVLVWADSSVPGGSWGRIYACSPSHPISVAIVTVYNHICPSPTGCSDWDQWNYTQVKITGSWVVASGAFVGSVDAIGLWNARARRRPRVVATLPGGPADINTYALMLRSDGAVAFAYQNINNNFRFFDVLDACGGGCHHLRRVDRVLYPADSGGERQRLTGVHFGADGWLFWRDNGRLQETRIG